MFGINLSFGKKDYAYKQDKQGNHIYEVISGGGNGKAPKTYAEKLNLVLSSPVALKVHMFLADTFSQAKFNEHSGNKVIEDFLYSEAKQPNPNQTWVELNWDIMFWLSLGNAYIYKFKDVVYCLNPANIELSKDQIKKFNRITFSQTNYKDTYKGTFKYKQNNGDVIPLELENLYVLNDLSGGISGDWLDGGSRIDAAYKIISNSNMALSSKGSNIEFTNKFFVSGKSDGSIDKGVMSSGEVKSLENSILGNKKVFATSYNMSVKPMVENIAKLQLDEAYRSDLLLYGNLYGIPKDVIDGMIDGSTYENQEKSLGKFVDYTLAPKAEQLANFYEVVYDKDTIKASFQHLPFNAVFEKEKTESIKLKLESLKIAQELGLDAKAITNELNLIYGLRN